MLRILLVHAAAVEARALPPLPPAVRTVEVGVGPARAAANLTRALLLGATPDLVVSFGVCGAQPERVLPAAPTTRLAVGSACLVEREGFADEGVETETGFTSTHELGLVAEATWLAAAEPTARIASRLGLPCVPSATVSTCSGTDARARLVVQRTGALVETMEGAAVAFVCARHGLPWIGLRVVSNFCGDRTRGAWDLDGAVATLGALVPRVLDVL